MRSFQVPLISLQRVIVTLLGVIAAMVSVKQLFVYSAAVAPPPFTLIAFKSVETLALNNGGGLPRDSLRVLVSTSAGVGRDTANILQQF